MSSDSLKKDHQLFYLLGESSGQPAVHTKAINPDGDPIEELALELVPMLCFLYSTHRIRVSLSTT